MVFSYNIQCGQLLDVKIVSYEVKWVKVKKPNKKNCKVTILSNQKTRIGNFKLCFISLLFITKQHFIYKYMKSHKDTKQKLPVSISLDLQVLFVNHRAYTVLNKISLVYELVL